jgi:carbonic anhydrase
MRMWRRSVMAGLMTAGLCGLWPAHLVADPLTPAEAIGRLKSGNTTFVTTPASALPITIDSRRALAEPQAPFAAVLSCADSRVPPEIVFHAGLGDLFVVRSSGHVADKSILASLEYATGQLHTSLIVVMGHESCDAVKIAIDTPATTSLGPNLDYMLKAIRPSAAAASSSPDAVRLRTAILKNVEETVNDLLDNSAALRHLSETGTIALVGAYYELSTGRVYFSEPVAVTLQAKAGGGH